MKNIYVYVNPSFPGFSPGPTAFLDVTRRGKLGKGNSMKSPNERVCMGMHDRGPGLVRRILLRTA